MEGLVAEALSRIEADGLSGLEELCARHPEQADALMSRVGWLVEGGLARPKGRDFPERLGDFRLIEPLGQGGMGIVYRAEDTSLGREVALKLVRPEQLYFPGARERFEREVTVVAGLAHPGVVPVYSVGEHEDLPYFAMELVRGATLGDVIEHLTLDGKAPSEVAGADLCQALLDLGGDPDESPSSLFEGPWPTVVARIVREIAEALEHAHRRGVLHRDVKPSNVMITRGGRVMLLDFGLSSAGSADRLTRTGLRVGSLPYMAPEQLAAEVELDRRVDVWSLGVTAYELLALALPFDASSEASLRLGIQTGAHTGLRQRNAQVSWELETIVQKSLEVDRTRRYRSAADLAHDLECALDGRPIQARRAGTWRRLRRWARRNPGTSVAASLGFLVLTVGPSVFAWQQLRANERVAAEGRKVQAANIALQDALIEVELQRDEARIAQQRAERNFDRATRAVDQMLTRVGGEDLRYVPRMEEVRRSLLLDALDFFDELLADTENQTGLWLPLASALHRSANIHGYLYEHAEAVLLLERERDALNALLEEEPRNLEAVRMLVENYSLRAHALRLSERYSEAEEDLRRALELLNSEVGQESLPDSTRRLALAELELGSVLEGSGQIEAAEETWRGTYAWLAAGDDRDAVLTESSSVAHRLGSLLSRLGRPDQLAEAEVLLTEATEGRERLLAVEPLNADVAYGLMESWINLTFVQMTQGRIEPSKVSCERACQLGRELTRDYPGVMLYQLDFGAALLNRAMVAMGAQEPGLGEPWFEETAQVLRPVVARRPDEPRAVQALLLALYNLTYASFERAEFDVAFALSRETIEVADHVAAERPLTPTEKHPLGFSLALSARTALELSDHEAAAVAARRALEFALAPGKPAAPGGADEVGDLIACFVRCAELAESDTELGAGARLELAERYLEEATETLALGLQRGAPSDAVLARLSPEQLERLLYVPAFLELVDQLGLDVQPR